RAFSHGLVIQGNYTWSHSLGTVNNAMDQTAGTTWDTLRNGNLSYGPLPTDRRHAVNIFGSYDLPIGQGRLVNLSGRWLNAALGGWTIGTVNTFYGGAWSTLTGGRLTFNAFAANSVTGADGGIVFGNGVSMDSLIQATTTQVGGFDKSCTCIR